jgi:hypothetical protein
MTAAAASEGPEPSLLWVAQYWRDELGVPYTDEHLRIAAGVDDGTLWGAPVVFPLPMYPLSTYGATVYMVDSKDDPGLLARPAVMPWIADIADPRDPNNGFYEEAWCETGCFQRWRGVTHDVAAPQVLVVPRNFEVLEDYGFRAALSDLALATPRVVRDWENTYRPVWHGSERAWRLQSILDYNESGDLEYVLGQAQIDALDDEWHCSPQLQSRYETSQHYAYGFLAELEREFSNTEQSALVNPVYDEIDPVAAFALHRSYERLRAASQPVWEAVAGKFGINIEMEGYPWD